MQNENVEPFKVIIAGSRNFSLDKWPLLYERMDQKSKLYLVLLAVPTAAAKTGLETETIGSLAGLPTGDSMVNLLAISAMNKWLLMPTLLLPSGMVNPEALNT